MNNQHSPPRLIFLGLVCLLLMGLLGVSMAFAASPTPNTALPQQDARTRIPTLSPTPVKISISTLRHFDGTYTEILEELQGFKLIPQGGSLVYETGYAFFDGRGSWYTPLAEYKPHTNFVFGGELEFRTSNTDDLEFCTMGTRMDGLRQTASYNYTLVGFDNDGDVLFLEQTDDRSRPFTTFELTGLDENEAHEFLIIAMDQVYTVYVDGRLVMEVDEADIREGSWGVVMYSSGYGGRCAASNIWIYELDLVWDSDEGVCGITVNREVNLREGPGTTFALAGSITANEVLDVVGQVQANDGFVWWQLTDDSWVRSDLVRELGNCEDEAPVIELEE